MTTIRLTGKVFDWVIEDDDDDEVESIRPEQTKDYEDMGWVVVTVEGSSPLPAMTTAIRRRQYVDGDITIQPKSDMYGRIAVAGRNTNFGYSGYFRGFVYLEGRRKTLTDFWTLFPNNEHHYAAQQDKARAEAAIRETLSAMAGTEVAKVKGGFAFDPVAHEERKAKKA